MISLIKKKPRHFVFMLATSLALALFVMKDRFTANFSHSPLPLPVPSYDENYAMSVILKYESFGPKVPGTQAHIKAGDWIIEELKTFPLTVHEQKAEAKTFDQKLIPIRNIIAQWNPKARVRYMLSAHWDNRPFADNDPKNKNKPVPGVNDGGSGVAVLLGIAKSLVNVPTQNADIGIDFAFWDSEDWGTPSIPESYCLGSQYWSDHLVPENYKAEFGINFDMVGRSGSIFPIDVYSEKVAPQVLKKLRLAALKIGYQDYFTDYKIGPIVDDHYFVSEKTHIPFIDLIYMTPEGKFAPEWHTVNDTSEFISRDVLKGVSQSVLQLLWTY